MGSSAMVEVERMMASNAGQLPSCRGLYFRRSNVTGNACRSPLLSKDKRAECHSHQQPGAVLHRKDPGSCESISAKFDAELPLAFSLNTRCCKVRPRAPQAC